MKLAQLVELLGGQCRLPSDGGPDIRDVTVDSRSARAGTLFVALEGGSQHGSLFVPDAVARGARAVLSDRPLARVEDGVVRWSHPGARSLVGRAAALVHGDPASGMFLVGITGTNGKTTTAHLLGQVLRSCRREVAVLGTTGYRLSGGRELPATHTTPDAAMLHRLLAEHREQGGDAAVLEVSSHALVQERTAGLDFTVAIYTNLSRDHLDYHRDLEDYADAKARLFAGLRPGAAAVINARALGAERMCRAAAEAGARVHTYAVIDGDEDHWESTAGVPAPDLRAFRLRDDQRGTRLLLNGMGITRTKLRLPLPGRFNVENALAASAAVLLSGASPSLVLEGLASVSPAPGRLEPVDTRGRGYECYVDYAHTEDALRGVCATLRSRLEPGARLIVVFGCGGDRDRGKRAGMGRAVAESGAVAVVTSDNPRREDPLAIIQEVLEGLAPGTQALIEPDRRAAIRAAAEMARPGDCVLIAGKGHETTQTVGQDIVAFDDRVVAAEVLA